MKAVSESVSVLVDALGDEGVILLDDQGRIASWNAGAAHLDGVEAIHVIGREFAENLLDEGGDRGVFAQWLRESRANGSAEGACWRLRRDGRAYWAAMRIVRTAAGFALVWRDESSDYARSRDLWEENDLLRSMQRSSPLDFWSVAAGGDRRMPAPARLLPGAQSSDWYRDGLLIHADDRAPVMAARQNAFADRRSYRVEYRTNEPEPRWMVEAAMPRFDRRGQWMGLTGYVEDVTRWKAAEPAAPPPENNAAEFAGELALEIRQSIGSILQSIQMAQESADQAEADMWINALDLSARMLLERVDNVAELARMSKRRTRRLKLVSFDPRALLREVFDAAANGAGERSITLSAEFHTELPDRVKGDATGTRQFLRVLLDQAVKFAESEVSLAVFGPDQEDAGPQTAVRFEVSFDGPALDAALSGWLSAPESTQSETAMAFGDTGVQLSLARRLVEAGGGAFHVLSNPPRFVCELEWLPSVAEAADDTGAIELRGKSMLAVTPDRSLRKVLQMRCAALGVSVMTVESIAEAKRVLGEAAPEAFDLMLAQCKMAGETGNEFSRLLSADPKWALRPRITVSMAGEPGQAQAAQDAGFHAYLTPPLPPELLRDTMLTLLARAATGHLGGLITRFSLAEQKTA